MWSFWTPVSLSVPNVAINSWVNPVRGNGRIRGIVVQENGIYVEVFGKAPEYV